MPFRSLWVHRLRHPSFRQRVAIPDGRPLIVGRAPDCDLQLESRAVSKRHAEIWGESGEVFARDLGSRNGTFLCLPGDADGHRIDEPERIGSRHALRVADFVLVPGEMLGPDVGLIDERFWPSSGETTPLTGFASEGDGHEERIAGVVDQLQRALSVRDGDAPVCRAVVSAFGAVVGADDAVLLSRHREHLALRARLRDDRPYALSRRFVEQVAKGAQTCILRLDGDGPDADSDGSLAELPESSVLVGLPLPGADDAAAAVFCANLGAGAQPDRIHGLERIAPLVGALVELELARDREQRRREALERTSDNPLYEVDPHSGLESIKARLVGSSPSFVRAVEAALQAARTTVTVLVRGPSGSGKDLMARLLHEAGPRVEHPFVARNCAAIPVELVESELFGHDKGSFTGATVDRAGAFQQADGGTLFLDEIGELAPQAQAKLLRAVESGEIVRVGGSTHRVDVRLIAASQRDLELMVSEGTFRADLYYRMRVVEIELPALSDRQEDILPLAEHFLRAFAGGAGRDISGISPAAARALVRYRWPGNVRELRNVIERAVVLDRDGVIDADDLPIDLLGQSPASPVPAGSDAGLWDVPWKEAKRRFGAAYFRRALEAHGGHVSKTARATGISRRALTNHLRDLEDLEE